ncbi:MAG: PilZ domain-containing protein [Candidatus Electrothrix aestuarii]|uniref:PilZ domain-containing protein n=1 Tax=Candidatus Electrothrix aestuarii TaxID=3062594 RepID=A0AAU8LUZ9_9BACT|nr:PilZ domain-containing protein [Candidatus Electrothrix aestuarii]WPD20786.1 MAG: PilZ domain-containing protein [Candidatus Electrothrix sp. GW3-3]
MIQSEMVYTTENCRRNSPRFDKQVKLTVGKLSYPMNNVDMKIGYTSNVSETGICFTCDELFENGTVIQLVVELVGWQHYLQTTSAIIDSDTVSKPLTAIAEVVWSKKLTDSEDMYAVGVLFKDIYEDDLQAFKKYLRKMLDKKS